MIETALVAMAALGMWFWIVMAVLSIALFISIENGSGLGATISAVLAVLVMNYLLGIGIIPYVLGHPVHIVAGFLAYLLLGMNWAVVKWWFFVRGMRRDYDEFREKWMREHLYDPREDVPAERRDDFYSDIPYEIRANRHPNVGNHKATIMTWMAYWPWSFFWTIINDPIMRMFRWAYRSLVKRLQRISDEAWSGIDKDLPSRFHND